MCISEETYFCHTRWRSTVYPKCHGKWRRVAVEQGKQCPCQEGPDFVFVQNFILLKTVRNCQQLPFRYQFLHNSYFSIIFESLAINQLNRKFCKTKCTYLKMGPGLPTTRFSDVILYIFIFHRKQLWSLTCKNENWETRQERNHTTKSLNLFKDLMPISISCNLSTQIQKYLILCKVSATRKSLS